MKDLRIIQNVDLHQVVLVDNSCYSFAYQVDNGIPIIPYYDDKTDEELCHLIFYIENLTHVQDVRHANQKAFSLHELGLEQEEGQAVEVSVDLPDDYELVNGTKEL